MITGPVATWSDVDRVCAWLNAARCNYILHGGFPLNMWLGSLNYLGDIDITLPRTLFEFDKMRTALGNLPERKILRYTAQDLAKKGNIRLIDSVTIDIMPHVSAINPANMEKVMVTRPGGVVIPMTSGDTLFRIKQFAATAKNAAPGAREKHAADMRALQAVGYNGNYTGRVIALDGSETPFIPPSPSEFDVAVDGAPWLVGL